MQQQVSQYVDENVTRQKFQQELDGFKKQKTHYRSMGVFLLDEEYPNAYFGFAAIRLDPTPFAFVVKINFTNYDIEPLSVKFIHPVTFQPLNEDQVPTKFPRRIDEPPGFMELLQADRDKVPFLCFAGVREYHDHTFHTGDSWFLHRKKGGEGSLCFILDNLQLYGASSIAAYHYPINLAVPNMKLISGQALISK